MASLQHGALRKGLVAVALFVFAGVSVVGYLFRDTLATACLRTVDGVTSKLAHMNTPFGSGASVEPRNPVLGIVPDFTLTDRSGKPVHKSDLLGGYWVASFIFTRCVTSCPKAVTQLTHLQETLPDDVRLVSFSVDPEYDSPEVLAEYADKVGADVGRWLFLTGEKTEVYRSIRQGFLLAVQENDGDKPGWEVTHSPRFALVDPKGRIRGYYDSSVPEDIERLDKDIERLHGTGEGTS